MYQEVSIDKNRVLKKIKGLKKWKLRKIFHKKSRKIKILAEKSQNFHPKSS